VGSASRSDNAGVNGNAQFNQDSLLLNMRIPLYQGGAEYSRAREAKARERQRRDETTNNKITVEESTTQAWQERQISIATITSREDQIKASQIALDGVPQRTGIWCAYRVGCARCRAGIIFRSHQSGSARNVIELSPSINF